MEYTIEKISLDRVKQINTRLKVISDELKAFQPKSPGAITLHHYDCGKNCSGCPHPRWKQWYLNTNNITRKFLSATIKSPLKRVKTSGKFSENSNKVKQLIKEAETLIKEKKIIIKSIRDFERKVIGAVKSSRSELNKIYKKTG